MKPSDYDFKVEKPIGKTTGYAVFVLKASVKADIGIYIAPITNSLDNQADLSEYEQNPNTVFNLWVKDIDGFIEKARMEQLGRKIGIHPEEDSDDDCWYLADITAENIVAIVDYLGFVPKRKDYINTSPVSIQKPTICKLCGGTGIRDFELYSRSCECKLA